MKIKHTHINITIICNDTKFNPRTVFGKKSRSWDGPGSHKNELGLHVH